MTHRRIPWRRAPLGLTVAACAALLGAVPALAQGSGTPGGAGTTPPSTTTPTTPTAPADVVLSDETTLTRWAHPATRGPIHASPTGGSRTIARLHPLTEDGFPEVYLLLRQHVDASGRTWIQIRVPARPNGRTGWVPRSALGGFHTVTTELVIDRRTLRATLYRSGRRVWSAPVGIGAPSLPTPAGHFWIREEFPVPRQYPAYGPFAFGTSAYSTKLTDWPGGGVVGIHGTDQPSLVPGRPSHGCVRLRNGDVRWLARHMPVGTPVLVR